MKRGKLKLVVDNGPTKKQQAEEAIQLYIACWALLGVNVQPFAGWWL